MLRLKIDAPSVKRLGAVAARRSSRFRPRLVPAGRPLHSDSSSQAPTAVVEDNNARKLKAGFSARSASSIKTSAVAISCLTVGYLVGQAHKKDHSHDYRVLPNGLPRTCCENANSDKSDKYANLTKEQEELWKKLRKLVGKENVIDGRSANTQTLPFLKGARLGKGRALYIVTPEYLQDVIDAVQLIVDADCVVVPQGQNTGLTGGSVPANDESSKADKRPSVVLSFKKLNRLFPLDNGQRVVCLAGTGLASLQQFLKKEFPNRESHSVLGSTFLDPTTAAGVAFGSGGTQLRKGPAYTDRALYLTISGTKWGTREVNVVDTLGIKGLDPNPETRKLDRTPCVIDRWSRLIQAEHERSMRYSSQEGKQLQSHDATYGARLCDFTSKSSSDDNSEISRFNADTRGSFPNRSEGKVIILATVHDTFPAPVESKTFWVSFDTLDTAFAFRRQVCLDNPQDLPTSLEYMDKDAVEVIDKAGRVLSNTILLVGMTSSILRQLWNLKLWVEALPFDGAPLWVDRFLYSINFLSPPGIPKPIFQMACVYQHHVAMTVGEFGQGELDRLVKRMHQFVIENGDKVKVYECKNVQEEKSLSAFRFAAAPAFRTYCVGKGLQGYSVDYALPKSKSQVPPLDADGSVSGAQLPLKRMRYSHFGCHVFHEDLAYGPDADIHKAKLALKHAVEVVSGGKLPSEHGHGREYTAPPETQERWKLMDPLNVLNPGIGGLSDKAKYAND